MNQTAITEKSWSDKLEALRAGLEKSYYVIDRGNTKWTNDTADAIEQHNSTAAIAAFYGSLNATGQSNFMRLTFSVLSPESAHSIYTDGILAWARKNINEQARADAARIIKERTADAEADRAQAAQELKNAEAWQRERATLLAKSAADESTIASLRSQVEQWQASAGRWQDAHDDAQEQAERLEKRLRKLAKIEKLVAAIADLEDEE